MALLLVVVAACDSGDDAGGADVCREVDREVLVVEQLAREMPSTVFTVEYDDDVWVGLISDSDFSESALFSVVVDLYVIDEGAPVEFERDATGGIDTDSLRLDFDAEGDYVSLDIVPGSYQLWSLKSPIVEVVRCGDTG